MTDRDRSLPERLPGAVALAAAVAVAVYAVSFVMAASTRDRLIAEDGIIETTTAFVFLIAAAAGAFGMARNGHRRLFWLVPAFGLVGFLDEMHYGTRLVGFSPPVVRGTEVDGLHDVLVVADDWLGGLGLLGLSLVVAGAVLVLVTAVWLFRSHGAASVRSWLGANPPLAFLAAAIGMLLLGIGLDVIASNDLAALAEEIAEFCAAGLTTVAAAHLLAPAPPPYPHERAAYVAVQQRSGR